MLTLSNLFFYFFFGLVMRKEKLEHHVIAGTIERKCSRGKMCGKVLNGLIKWFKIGRVTDAQGIKMCARS